MVDWVEVTKRPPQGEDENEFHGDMQGVPLVGSTLRSGTDRVLVTFGFRDREFCFPTQTVHDGYHYLITSSSSNTRNSTLTYLLNQAVQEFRRNSEAERKARRLLTTFITRKQNRMLRSSRYFHERGRVTGSWYRFCGWSTSVRPVRRVKVRMRETGGYLCLHVGNLMLPYWDTILGQLLLMRSDEEEFLRRATFHPEREGAQAA